MPYGINTPAGFLAAYNIMLPLASVRKRRDAPEIAPEIPFEMRPRSACHLGGISPISRRYLAQYYLSNDPTISKEDWVNKTFQSACACNFLGGIVEILGE